MSAKERIAKLEELLARVQARAAERPGRASEEPASFAAAVASGTQVISHERVVGRSSPPSSVVEDESDRMVDSDVDSDGSLEVSEMVEIDIDIDEPGVAAELAHGNPMTLPPGDLEEDEPSPMAARASALDEASQDADNRADVDEELAPPPPAANEIEEPAPSSSRRPIAPEVENVPRRTPPPESGKQIATSPSAHPGARKSGGPPPMSPVMDEGLGLRGGWHEPGLAAQGFSAESPTAVRGPSESEAGSAFAMTLTPDVTRASIASRDADVARFEGATYIAKPTTLGELLDMTLGL